ncbi:MAG: hypothetical protein HY784_12190 [Chloroflexi bacterium]|nr:hypothetical protein [Chloroflexota bacterium]
MKKAGSVVVKVMLFVLALLLVLALPLSLLAYNVGRVVFDRELVNRVVTDEVVNSELLPVVLEWFSERRARERVEQGEALVWVDEPDVVKAMAYLDRAGWKLIKAEVLTAEVLAEWVRVAVFGAYDWIDSADRVPQITWETQRFIERINTEHGLSAINILYDALPPCRPEEVADFQSRQAAAPAGAEVLYNLCEFPPPWYEDQHQDYLDSLPDVVKNVPRQFALTHELGQSGDNPQGVGPEQIKAQLRLIRLLYRWSLLIPLALLLLILLFGVRSLRALGHWWGIPLALGGLLALLPALTYRPLITRVLASGPLSEVPALVQQETTRSVLRLAAEIFRPVLIESLVILAVGLLLVAVGALRRQPRLTAA